MKRMFRLATLVLVFVMLLGSLMICMTGCKKNADNEIILWWPSGRAYQSMLNDALTRFRAVYPDVQVKVQYKDIDAFDAYKYALNDDKTRPDVAILDHVYVQALAKDKQIMNLTDSTADIKAMFPAALYNANTYGTDVYALPMSANTVVLMANLDMLKAAGVVDENGNAKIPKTFDELLDACEKVEASGQIAFAQPLNSFAAMEFASYVARNGGSLISADGKRATFTDEKVVKALSDWKKLSKYANNNTYEEDKFYNGKVAFVEMGSWSLPKVTGSSRRFNCGFSEMVTIDATLPNNSGLGLYSLCVAEKTRNRDAAVALAEFLATDKTIQLAFNQEKKLFPVTNETLSDSYYTDDDAFCVFAAQLQKVAPRPATPAWPAMEQAIVNMLFEVVKSNASDTTSLSAIAQRYQTQVQAEIDNLNR